MGFFKRLTQLITPSSQPKEAAYWFTVRCSRCGEEIRGRVDTRNELSINYGEGDQGTTYFCRKTLSGEKLCFQRIEVELTFDANRKLIERKISGGEFIDQAS